MGQTLRKARQLVRKIQIGDESVNNRLKIIGIDDITSEDANKLVVMITNRDNLKALESVPSLSVDAMIRDILGITQPAGKPEEIVNLFASYGPQLYDDDEYVPIFHYLNQVERVPDNTYIRRFTEDKETQFRKKIQSIWLPKTMQNKLDCQEDAIRSIDSSKEYLWPRIVMLMFDDGKLSEEQAINCLRYVYEKGENVRKTSDMKCAVSYIGFKRYKIGRGPRVNHVNPEPGVCRSND